jgi:hypothetical protein
MANRPRVKKKPLPCFCAEEWKEDCASQGKFTLAWCGQALCKPDALRRHGHWVTQSGKASCLACSKKYQDDGQLDAALKWTLQRDLCEACLAAGVPSEAPAWYKPPAKAERNKSVSWASVLGAVPMPSGATSSTGAAAAPVPNNRGVWRQREFGEELWMGWSKDGQQHVSETDVWIKVEAFGEVAPVVTMWNRKRKVWNYAKNAEATLYEVTINGRPKDLMGQIFGGTDLAPQRPP